MVLYQYIKIFERTFLGDPVSNFTHSLFSSLVFEMKSYHYHNVYIMIYRKIKHKLSYYFYETCKEVDTRGSSDPVRHEILVDNREYVKINVRFFLVGPCTYFVQIKIV